jgi:hypothetical protein
MRALLSQASHYLFVRREDAPSASLPLTLSFPISQPFPPSLLSSITLSWNYRLFHLQSFFKMRCSSLIPAALAATAPIEKRQQIAMDLTSSRRRHHDPQLRSHARIPRAQMLHGGYCQLLSSCVRRCRLSGSLL